MIDIEFFKKSWSFKQKIISGHYHVEDIVLIAKEYDSMASKEPFVFNIETTNNCNMRCIMCPRTNLMKRSISDMPEELYKKILSQIKPHSKADIEDFWSFINDAYDIDASTKNEDSFYFHIIADSLTLHGYGEPLLDKKIISRVEQARDRNIKTYFSCVPANLNVEFAQKLMSAGLNTLKVSIDGLSDEKQKRIRGQRNNFEAAYKVINEILKMRDTQKYQTLVVPTMIALSDSDESLKEQEAFLKLWDNRPGIFAYIKSQDNRWLYSEDTPENISHHNRQFCEFPWLSMTINVDGSVVPCTQDYNTEICLGNAKDETLEAIWNGQKYAELRKWHVSGDFPPGHKCLNRCDQRKIFQFLKNG